MLIELDSQLSHGIVQQSVDFLGEPVLTDSSALSTLVLTAAILLSFLAPVSVSAFSTTSLTSNSSKGNLLDLFDTIVLRRPESRFVRPAWKSMVLELAMVTTCESSVRLRLVVFSFILFRAKFRHSLYPALAISCLRCSVKLLKSTCLPTVLTGGSVGTILL
jgi:hypothetical protein